MRYLADIVGLEGWLGAMGLLMALVCSLLLHHSLQRRQLLEKKVNARTASLNQLLCKYLNITHNLPLGLAIYQKGMIQEMNPILQSWFGDPADLHKQLDALLKAAPSEHDITLQTHLGRKQMRCCILDMPIEGSENARMIFMEDRTERLRAEKALKDKTIELERHFSSSTDLLSISTLDGSFLTLNPQWERTLGHSVAEMTGQHWQNFVIKADQDKAKELLKRLCDGQPVLNFPLRFAHKDGRDIWLEWKASREGNLIHANVRDVTERMEAEEKNRSMREHVARAQKMESIGRLAGGIAHDFNNSLQVIIGNAQLVQSDPSLSPDRQSQVQDILKAAERSAQLTRQLLGFAMKQHVHANHTVLNQLLKEMEPMFHTVLGDHIQLRWELDKNLDSVKIDRNQLEQICMNLLQNARDAMHKGGRVTLRTRNRILFRSDLKDLFISCTPGEYISFSIEDNGPGIDPAVRATLFEPFTTTRDPSKGSGLGLATVYGILQQNKGSIRVDSSKQGTCIEIFLPKEMEDQPKANPATSPSPHKKSILLVDDNPQVLQLTKLVLQELKYETHPCHTASEALTLLKAHPEISVLVTDMMMPEMSGQDLYEKVLQIRPDIKCVFMSGYSSEVVAPSLLKNGKTAFINKPFSVDTIETVLGSFF